MVFIWVYAKGWDIETVIQNEISQEEKKYIYINVCMWNPEKMNLFVKQN